MLKFKIFEIPDAHSERTINLESDALDLTPLPFKGGKVKIGFYKTSRFIQAKLHIQAKVELVCDRSLDAFDYDIDKDYEIMFESDETEESSDEHGAIRNIDPKTQQIDCEQDVRDTILLGVPIKKLHPRFLDENGNPKEFLSREFGKPEGEETDEIDPRWDALKELKNNY